MIELELAKIVKFTLFLISFRSWKLKRIKLMRRRITYAVISSLVIHIVSNPTGHPTVTKSEFRSLWIILSMFKKISTKRRKVSR